MSAPPKRAWTREDYDRDAQEYLASLPLEHFMESTPQATQRAATVASLELMPARLPGFRCFNELLVQRRAEQEMLRVVPDNMVALGVTPSMELTSWALALAPCPIFWVLEYVSESSHNKDYVDNFEIYETELKIPYYLIFDPEHQDLQLYHHEEGRYVPVEANEAGRYPLPEVEMEVAVLDGWTRFWHKGELLPLPTEMQTQLGEMGQRLDEERRAREKAEKDKERIEQENTRITKENERIGKEKDLAEREKERVERENARIARENERIEQAKQLAEREKQRVEQENARIAKEKDAAEQRVRQSEQNNLQLTKDKDLLQQQLNAQGQTMTALLRPLVEARARQAGRQDVLDLLPATTDGGQLARWLAEMG